MCNENSAVNVGKNVNHIIFSRKCFVIGMALLLAGCAPLFMDINNRRMAHYTGMTEKNVVDDWGKPDRRYVAGDDVYLEYQQSDMCVSYVVIRHDKVIRTGGKGDKCKFF